jgi:hypothetical protein
MLKQSTVFKINLNVNNSIDFKQYPNFESLLEEKRDTFRLYGNVKLNENGQQILDIATYNFNITASDGVNTSSRAFAVVSNYVPPFTTSIGFGGSSQVSSISSYTGADGVTRNDGKCGPGTETYHGVSLNKYFPADKDFELIIQVSKNSNGTPSASPTAKPRMIAFVSLSFSMIIN